MCDLSVLFCDRFRNICIISSKKAVNRLNYIPMFCESPQREVVKLGRNFSTALDRLLQHSLIKPTDLKRAAPARTSWELVSLEPKTTASMTSKIDLYFHYNKTEHLQRTLPTRVCANMTKPSVGDPQRKPRASSPD